MKAIQLLTALTLALPLMFNSCRTSSKIDSQQLSALSNGETAENDLRSYTDKIAQKHLNSEFITSKIKFSVVMGNQNVSLTGNLKMRKNDVIRLQLMAFGFVEAARIEFTKEYVLIMDRINKQYLKVPYSHLDFLRTSGINFNTLQALFWNELFMPGRTALDNEALSSFNAVKESDNVILKYDKDKLSYKWLLNETGEEIKMSNILYRDLIHGNSQLNWDYSEFQPFSGSKFPTRHQIRLNLPNKEISIKMTLNYLDNETEWEPRTTISGRYKEVKVDDILRRIMAL